MNSVKQSTEYLLTSKDIKNPKNLEELGYIFYGPLILNYFLWLIKETKNADVILFNSREGYFLKQIYDYLKLHFNLKPSIYFKTSRKLSFISSIKSKKDIYDSFNLHRYEGSLDNLLNDRFGIKVNSKNITKINTKIEIPDLDSYVNSIIENSIKTHDNYKKYINEVLKDYKKIYMVDSGYQGTSQYYLQKAFNLNLKGRYMTYKGNLNLDNTYGFYDFNNCKFKDNIIFFESVFTENVGTYIDIKNNKFINDLDFENQKMFKYKIKIIKGIKKFIKDILNLKTNLNSIEQTYADNLFNLMCTSDFIKNNSLFDTFYHDNLYIGKTNKKLIRN